MPELVLSVGTNTRHEQQMLLAFDALQQRFGELTLSPIYKSPPLDQQYKKRSSQQNRPSKNCSSHPFPRYYYNSVVVCSTNDTLINMHNALREIEAACGRDRSSVAKIISSETAVESVAMDIDLLLYDQQVGVVDNTTHIASSQITLPHPDILRCAYVLRPLSDVFPQAVHPVEQQTFFALWQQFSRQLDQTQLLTPVDCVWKGQVISVAPVSVMR